MTLLEAYADQIRLDLQASFSCAFTMRYDEGPFPKAQASYRPDRRIGVSFTTSFKEGMGTLLEGGPEAYLTGGVNISPPPRPNWFVVQHTVRFSNDSIRFTAYVDNHKLGITIWFEPDPNVSPPGRTLWSRLNEEG